MDGRSFWGLKSDLLEQSPIGQGLLFFCYSALENCIFCSDAADIEYMARKTPAQRIMRIERKN